MRKIQGRVLIKVGEDIEVPILGSIAFGLIDRGTNVIQVRPVSFCNLNCIMCSTDAGPYSKWRQVEYWVPPEILLDGVREIIKYKGIDKVEAHIDTVGEPTLYSRLIELVQGLKDIREVKVVSVQTHGQNLSEHKVEELSEAGLDRINLSVDAIDEKLAKYIQGAEWYNVRKVLRIAEYTLENTKIDIHIAPVYLPGINDEEIPKIIKWALKIGAGKKWPPLGIQKYIPHKHGRKAPVKKVMSWYEFWNYLKSLERRFKVKLIPRLEDFGMFKTKPLPKPFRVGEKVRVKIVAPGWLKGEKLAVDLRGLRTITVVNAEELPEGTRASVRIVRNKDNIYVAIPT